MKIAIASDHGGFPQKAPLADHIRGMGHEVVDFGPETGDSVDYPDYAVPVAHAVASGECDYGILICGTGLGMAIAADKVPGIRAVPVQTEEFCKLSREHNNANVLCLSGRFVELETNERLVDIFLGTEWAGGHHAARVAKISELDRGMAHLVGSDPDIAKAIDDELARERSSVELIASENFVSLAVMEAVGSPLTNKYAEGYPGKRYYGGCWAVDEAEEIARSRAKELFGCGFANVQPHSGAQANYAALAAVASPGDTIMGMSLDCGGHLTHGSPANFSGKLYNVVPYGLDPETERIDYDEVARLAAECKPKVIIAGASAYPRIIDFERFAQIAHDNGAVLMVDMAHIAGLVATGAHPSPIGLADIVTTTTHKTLRGTRGGMILTNDEALAKKVNSAVFPGSQGGPLEHVIAGKAVALGEALQPSFKTYIDHVVENAAALGRGMASRGLRLVTGGTDNHLLLVDLTTVADGEVTGKQLERALESVGITVNKNTIPGEKRSPFVTSGIRVGSAAISTRGFDAKECERIGELIGDVTASIDDEAKLSSVRDEVAGMLALHPLYPELG